MKASSIITIPVPGFIIFSLWGGIGSILLIPLLISSKVKPRDLATLAPANILYILCLPNNLVVQLILFPSLSLKVKVEPNSDTTISSAYISAFSISSRA